MAVGAFLDTSVLLAGLVDFGPQSAPAQSVLHAVAEKIVKDPATAWHCCLEFFSVATRLPAEYRLTPADAVHLLEEEVFARMTVHELPPESRLPLATSSVSSVTSTGVQPLPTTHWFGRQALSLTAHCPWSGSLTQTPEPLQVSVVQSKPSSQSSLIVQPVHTGGTCVMSQTGASAVQP